MKVMAKKKTPNDSGKQDDGKSRPPSRDKVRYVAIPTNLHDALVSFAESRSDEFDKKSISWAARVAIAGYLREQGLWPPPQKDDDGDAAQAQDE